MDYKKLAAGASQPYSFPTAESVFGPNPWARNPQGKELQTGQTYPRNPYYFATPVAAQKAADMLGGKVVESVGGVTPFGPFVESTPMLMIELPNGRKINAGLFMSNWDHGYEQNWIDRLVESDLS